MKPDPVIDPVDPLGHGSGGLTRVTWVNPKKPWFVFSSVTSTFQKCTDGCGGRFFWHFLSFFSPLFFSFIYLFGKESCRDSCLRFKSVLCLICGNFQVEVEALVIQGPKLGTMMSQVKKLEASVLVLGQKRPSTLISWWVQHFNLHISKYFGLRICLIFDF